MMDLINSCFLFGEIIVVLHAYIKLDRAKDSRAISLLQCVFFLAWQIFGICFYWSINKPVSVGASVAVAIVLAGYSFQVWQFRKGQQ